MLASVPAAGQVSLEASVPVLELEPAVVQVLRPELAPQVLTPPAETELVPAAGLSASLQEQTIPS
ncbi:MAG: hypothetical protein PHV18_11140 [Lachnospiraceae bacterium]|nr:hypothetical protein [Lachnospiraceae bacterium]